MNRDYLWTTHQNNKTIFVLQGFNNTVAKKSQSTSVLKKDVQPSQSVFKLLEPPKKQKPYQDFRAKILSVQRPAPEEKPISRVQQRRQILEKLETALKMPILSTHSPPPQEKTIVHHYRAKKRVYVETNRPNTTITKIKRDPTFEESLFDRGIII